MKAKLAKYRGQLLEPSGKKGEKGEGFDVLKSGDARAVMIGFPSVGKVGFYSIRNRLKKCKQFILPLFVSKDKTF